MRHHQYVAVPILVAKRACHSHHANPAGRLGGLQKCRTVPKIRPLQLLRGQVQQTCSDPLHVLRGPRAVYPQNKDSTMSDIGVLMIGSAGEEVGQGAWAAGGGLFVSRLEQHHGPADSITLGQLSRGIRYSGCIPNRTVAPHVQDVYGTNLP